MSLKHAPEQVNLNKDSVVQGETCNSAWLDKSLVIDLRDSLNADSLSVLVMAAWDDIADFCELGPLQSLVTFSSYDAMLDALYPFV